MNYYIVFLCNWPAESNAIVRSVELTTTDPSSYVTSTNDYVFLDLTKHLNSGEEKKFGNSVQSVMSKLTQQVGYLSVNKQAKSTTEVRMADVLIRVGAPAYRKLTTWNDVVKPAWIRAAHTSLYGTL